MLSVCSHLRTDWTFVINVITLLLRRKVEAVRHCGNPPPPTHSHTNHHSRRCPQNKQPGIFEKQTRHSLIKERGRSRTLQRGQRLHPCRSGSRFDPLGRVKAPPPPVAKRWQKQRVHGWGRVVIAGPRALQRSTAATS